MARQSGSLRTYVLTRLVLVIPMVWILLTMVFVLMRVAPGDPVTASLGGRLSPADLAARREALGLDRPLLVQYVDYLRDVLTFNFGRTITDNRPIREIIVDNGGATLELSIAALIVAVGIGLPFGLIAGRYRDRVVDVVLRLFGIITYAAPVFFVGLLLQLVVSQRLGLLPSSGQASAIVQATVPTKTHILALDALISGDSYALWDVIKHLILPAVTLGLLVCGVFIRLVRVNVAQTLQGDYIEAARARGIGERKVVVQHAFRNALVPVITVMGLQAALLLGGAVLTENTFNWPGLGSQLIAYLNGRDYAAVQGIITVFALAVVVISLLIDFVNALVDPRVRY
ncbi:MAG TPA: ABC transporter permease [Streptosporangiaceae bacterium]|jgi:peptide/nickel transport system permease protein|nr:ABC transporter permease [Streptosporangiaceae bacterium]